MKVVEFIPGAAAKQAAEQSRFIRDLVARKQEQWKVAQKLNPTLRCDHSNTDELLSQCCDVDIDDSDYSPSCSACREICRGLICTKCGNDDVEGW